MTEIPLWAWLLIALGVGIIAVLAYIAGRLLAQLRQQRQAQQQAANKRDSHVVESVVTIAMAMEQGQCELSEGALRIAVLLDHHSSASNQDYVARYPAIYDMYERIKHMPTHSARKQRPKAEIRAMDKQREGYERELEQALVAEARALVKAFRSL
ncbi:MAG: Uncharacterised protein [Pseudidiomarina mangrovi]|nr:MAG: Uncharacterised protein [Pseudidiomarina mangrovi]